MDESKECGMSSGDENGCGKDTGDESRAFGFLALVTLLPSIDSVKVDSQESLASPYLRNPDELAQLIDTPDEWKTKDFHSSLNEFNCEILPPSDTIPTSVHKLRPADINVVAALGDSITAGFGAKSENISTISTQYRGISWSIGGDDSLEDGVLTLPNVLRKYNADLKGWSVETGGSRDYNISRLNVAIPGSRSTNMRRQAEDLVERLLFADSVDYINDWKVVTIFIGGNDLCASCNFPERHSAQQYTENVKEALDYMHQTMPRTFVNLAQTVVVTETNKFNTSYCNQFSLCTCAKQWHNDDWEDVLQLTWDYHTGLKTLISTGQYDTREDFTVVIQPFFEETYVPPDGEGGWDHRMFAPDCFHFNEYGHQACAMSLWNNMIEPVGAKRTAWRPGDILECPSEDFEYFYTYLNFRVSTTTANPLSDVSTSYPVDDEPTTTCEDYTGAFITAIVILSILLLVCFLGIIWLVYKMNSNGKAYLN
uniref:Phospholipase B1, membrane-associated n=1 Tax=Saccoglossus kowalevskii TaxID=10224 RepID=A0ABM0MKE6_SACKO|nr:PREDICTED: phospholipase B1, membrane-associated-like [Saccoglossus kowalevskii]